MTCVAGLVYENKVWIGADSAGVMNYSLTPRKDPKVFINNNLIIGFTSSFRMGQLLKWNSLHLLSRKVRMLILI